MWELPAYCALIARVQTRSALYAVLKLEVHIALIIKRVALGRAHTRGAFMGARRIAYIGIHLNVRPRIGASLVPVIDHSQPFGYRQSAAFAHGLDGIGVCD